jgi:TatD DNase family protein
VGENLHLIPGVPGATEEPLASSTPIHETAAPSAEQLEANTATTELSVPTLEQQPAALAADELGSDDSNSSTSTVIEANSASPSKAPPVVAKESTMDIPPGIIESIVHIVPQADIKAEIEEPIDEPVIDLTMDEDQRILEESPLDLSLKHSPKEDSKEEEPKNTDVGMSWVGILDADLKSEEGEESDPDVMIISDSEERKNVENTEVKQEPNDESFMSTEDATDGQAKPTQVTAQAQIDSVSASTEASTSVPASTGAKPKVHPQQKQNPQPGVDSEGYETSLTKKNKRQMWRDYHAQNDQRLASDHEEQRSTDRYDDGYHGDRRYDDRQYDDRRFGNPRFRRKSYEGWRYEDLPDHEKKRRNYYHTVLKKKRMYKAKPRYERDDSRSSESDVSQSGREHQDDRSRRHERSSYDRDQHNRGERQRYTEHRDNDHNRDRDRSERRPSNQGQRYYRQTYDRRDGDNRDDRHGSGHEDRRGDQRRDRQSDFPSLSETVGTSNKSGKPTSPANQAPPSAAGSAQQQANMGSWNTPLQTTRGQAPVRRVTAPPVPTSSGKYSDGKPPGYFSQQQKSQKKFRGKNPNYGGMELDHDWEGQPTRLSKDGPPVADGIQNRLQNKAPPPKQPPLPPTSKPSQATPKPSQATSKPSQATTKHPQAQSAPSSVAKSTPSRQEESMVTDATKAVSRHRSESEHSVSHSPQQAKTDSRQGRRTCPFPDCDRVTLSTHHMFREGNHLPGVFHPRLQGDDVAQRRLACLEQIARRYTGRPDLRKMLSMLEKHPDGYFASIAGPTVESQSKAMAEFIRIIDPSADLSKLDFSEIRVFENHVGALIDWRVITPIMSDLDPSFSAYLCNSFGLEPNESEMICTVPKAVDSHYHLDRLEGGYQKLEDVPPPQDIPPNRKVNLLGAIANFCDPATWPSKDAISNWNFKPTVGVHPTKYWELKKDESKLKQLKELIFSDRVSGLGEVGLQQKYVNSKHQELLDQKRFLTKTILPLVNEMNSNSPDGLHKVLVLHCRGEARIPAHRSLMVDALRTCLIEAKIPPTQLIHFHCFTGSFQDAQEWISSFPNTYFGFTKIRSSAFARMDINRILLETDAPYFPFDNKRSSTPYDIGQVACLLAPERNMEWEELVEAAANNASRLYVLRNPPQEASA